MRVENKSLTYIYNNMVLIATKQSILLGLNVQHEFSTLKILKWWRHLLRLNVKQYKIIILER